MRILLSLIVLAASGSALGAERTVVDALSSGDRAAAIQLLNHGADVNARGPDGGTALMLAAYADDLELVKRLIAAGADAKAQNEYGASALSEAAYLGSAPVIAALLKAGVDPNSRNAEGETALMLTARTGHVDAARMLLDSGSNGRLTATTIATPRSRSGTARRESRSGSRDCRCCACSGSGSTGGRSNTPRRTCLPAASSISSPTPTTRAASSSRIPTGVDGKSEQIVTVRTRFEPRPFRRRTRLPRLSAGLHRHEAGTGIHRTAGGLLHGLVPLRQLQYLSAAGPTRRHDPDPCRALQGRSLPLRRRRRAGSRHHLRRDLFPHAERHARQADCHQGGRRRRGDLRRRRRSQPVRCDGRQRQLLRRADDSQHGDCVPGRPEEHHRLSRPDDQTLPVREHRAGRADRLVGLEGLLHRRQRLHRHARIPNHLIGTAGRTWQSFAEFPNEAVVGVRGEGLRLGTRGGVQLHRQLP